MASNPPPYESAKDLPQQNLGQAYIPNVGGAAPYPSQGPLPIYTQRMIVFSFIYIILIKHSHSRSFSCLIQLMAHDLFQSHVLSVIRT
jgi:hypothetical protein